MSLVPFFFFIPYSHRLFPQIHPVIRVLYLFIPQMTLNNNTHPTIKKTSKSKLFQCSGFGNCQMIFTRSEHLARHIRKHTGEKPFNCVVPGCKRRFSRLDNMMQHTQTHTNSRHSNKHCISHNNDRSTSIYDITHKGYDNMTTNNNVYDKQPLIKYYISHPSQTLLGELHLTQDEFEAIQGFGRFRHTPIIIESFRGLASVVYIEPNPTRT
ncbi:hypothetical protein BDB01DRAFT_790804 [Pilobolus umbonatus]|nr:hypothetical protein BDB01DRAFT_790804 [Pilobolus umbonatus]